MNYYLKFIPIHPRHPIIRPQILMNVPKNGGFGDKLNDDLKTQFICHERPRGWGGVSDINYRQTFFKSASLKYDFKIRYS